MTQKTGRFGASGREFCLYSLEKEDIEETLQLMDRCVGENLYQKEELEQAIGSIRYVSAGSTACLPRW